MAELTLAERLEALARALLAGGQVLPAELVARGRAVESSAGDRLRLSGDHTVVAVAGSTGSGKSSLVNALAREEVARVDVLRPTTSEPLAVVRGDGAGPLLDWLGVRRRHRSGGTVGGPADDGLVLLDLPDHDSVVPGHRLEAERLVAMVDLMVWVVDPQKYADAALHERYLRPLAGHAGVLLVVLNQVDRLGPEEREACHRDLRRLLDDGGLREVRLLDVSARTGEGVDALRAELDEAARRREASRLRIEADVVAVAHEVRGHCWTEPPAASRPGARAVRPTRGERTEERAARARMLASLEIAAGVPVVAEAVRGTWFLRARRATGWPPTRWLTRFRPDPLRRLHLSGQASEPDPEHVRTSLPAPGAAEEARARGAVRDYADAATAGAPRAWVLAARQAAEQHDLTDPLDRAVSGTPLAVRRRPAWWSVVGALQWLLVAVLVVGLVWLAALAGLASLQVPVPEPPRWGEVPWPTLAAVGGAALGLVLALLSRAPAAFAARRKARQATARLRAAVAGVAEQRVVTPVEAVLDRLQACRVAAELAAAPPATSATTRPRREGRR